MILSIESSCDESALALFSEEEGLLGEWVHSQIALHSRYGGVVPALASREHLHAFGPLLEILLSLPQFQQIDRVAVTCGPGLAGCLALGLALGKALSLARNVPMVGVNHLRGHAFSPFIYFHKENPQQFPQRFKEIFPHLGLIVSGGNTLLFEMDADLSLSIVAQTVDDAAGEALDKGAKLLGMSYPGGALIEKEAANGNPQAFDFPRAFSQSRDMRFSFSGLKTSLRYRLEKMSDDELKGQLKDICASYQEAVVGALAHKTKQVLRKKQYASLGLSGGVANNRRLRSVFRELSEETNVSLFVADPKHTGDNAAMIAFAAYVDPQSCVSSQDFDLSFHPTAVLDH